MDKKAQKVFLEAARSIAEGREEFSCCAVDQAYLGFSDYRDVYCHTMGIPESLIKKPTGVDYVYEAVGLKVDGNEDNTVPKEVRDFRILLLCMMAACYEDVK